MAFIAGTTDWMKKHHTRRGKQGHEIPMELDYIKGAGT
jgi:hypothetical protein